MKAEIDGEWIDFDTVGKIGKYVISNRENMSQFSFTMTYTSGAVDTYHGEQFYYDRHEQESSADKFQSWRKELKDPDLEALRQKCIDAFMGEVDD